MPNHLIPARAKNFLVPRKVVGVAQATPATPVLKRRGLRALSVLTRIFGTDNLPGRFGTDHTQKKIDNRKVKLPGDRSKFDAGNGSINSRFNRRG